MELDFAFLAAAGDLGDGKFAALGGGFDTFETSEIPVQVPPVALLFRFSISEDEREAPHDLRLLLLGLAEKLRHC